MNEFKTKEAKVYAVHKNKITKTTEKKRDRIRVVYQTRLKDKRPRRYTYEELIEYVYSYYYPEEQPAGYTFKEVFERALDEKIRTEAPKEKTVRDIRNSYKAFVTDELGKRDIREIRPSEVKEYIQTLTSSLHPTRKRLYKLKSTLNLVFKYAVDPEHAIIRVNPVPESNAAYKKNCAIEIRRPEDKAFQPHEIKLVKEHLWKRLKNMRYDINGFAILFSIETGMREGEIPALKWEDVGEKSIHIHAQQNDEKVDGKKTYYYNPCTKNEKGVSQNGRYFPITNEIRKILNALSELQKSLKIESEWVFCKENGDWITTTGYYASLYKVTKKLGLSLSNNHAFRMALNSYVFIPAGLSAPERAKLLGHSVQTNINYYTFARADDYIMELKDTLDVFNGRSEAVEPQGDKRNLNIVQFRPKEKPLEINDSRRVHP